MKDDVIMEMNRLIVEASSINAIIEGMKAFNQACISREGSLGYSEGAFLNESDKLKEIAQAIEKLK